MVGIVVQNFVCVKVNSNIVFELVELMFEVWCWCGVMCENMLVDIGQYCNLIIYVICKKGQCMVFFDVIEVLFDFDFMDMGLVCNCMMQIVDVYGCGQNMLVVIMFLVVVMSDKGDILY